MFKFFVDQKISNYFSLSQENLQHIKIVRIQDEKFICVYKSQFFICVLENKKAKILEELKQDNEFSEPITIGISIIDIKRFEWAIQKAAELGATTFIPIISSRVSQKWVKNSSSKLKRWNKISLHAAEQSFRNKKMNILLPVSFKKALEYPAKNKFIAYTKHNNKPHISYPGNSLFLVGPEGGFTKAEIDQAQKNNFQVVSLGPRILKTETAAIFLLSRVNP